MKYRIIVVLTLILLLASLSMGCSESEAVYITGDVICMPHDLDAIHKGYVYTYTDYVELGNGESRNLLLITPASPRLHFRFEIYTESESAFYIYEDAIISKNGTAVTIINRERNSASMSNASLYYAPTIDADGTSILVLKQGAGKSSGMALQSIDEFVLKHSTNYVIRVTNDVANDNWVTIRLNWHER